MDKNVALTIITALVGIGFTLLQLWINARYRSLYDAVVKLSAEVSKIRDTVDTLKDKIAAIDKEVGILKVKVER